VQSRASAARVPVQDEPVKFVLEVDMGDTAFHDHEVGRWAIIDALSPPEA
jgi:hypothetical protein